MIEPQDNGPEIPPRFAEASSDPFSTKPHLAVVSEGSAFILKVVNSDPIEGLPRRFGEMATAVSDGMGVGMIFGLDLLVSANALHMRVAKGVGRWW